MSINNRKVQLCAWTIALYNTTVTPSVHCQCSSHPLYETWLLHCYLAIPRYWSGQLVSLCNVSRCNCTYVLKTLSAKSHMSAVTSATYVYRGRQPHTTPASPGVCALSYWGSSSRCRHRSPAQGGLGRRSRTRSFWEGPPAHCPWCLVFLTPGEACSSTHSGDPCTDLVGEEGWGGGGVRRMDGGEGMGHG